MDKLFKEFAKSYGAPAASRLSSKASAIREIARESLSPEFFKIYKKRAGLIMKTADYKTIEREMADPEFALKNARMAEARLQESIEYLKLRHAPKTLIAAVQSQLVNLMSAWAAAFNIDLEDIRVNMEKLKSVVLDSCVERENSLNAMQHKLDKLKK